MALMNSQNRTELITRLMLNLVPIASTSPCTKCRSTRNIEWHHVCGQQYDPEVLLGRRGYIVPLCRLCHRGRWGIHKALAQARIDLQYTADENERNQRAWRAFLVFLWWLDERLEPDSKQ
jgi:hypothetical protein